MSDFEGLCNSDYFSRNGLVDAWKGENTRGSQKGKVRVSWNHVSPSQIENYTKCKRSWFFKSIQKIPEAQKGHQSLGEAFHLIMEKVPQGLSWPNRADVSASPEDWDKADAMAKIALPLIPADPDKRFKREHGIRLATYEGGPTMVGYIDLGIPSGIGWPAFMFPFDEAIVADYKTLSDFRYMKTPQELADSVQMMTYAKWAIEPWPMGLHSESDPTPEHVRLLHLYARTKAPFTANSIRYESALVTPSEINTRWEKTLDVVREMQQVSSCTNADDVEANGALNGHCEAYGGCHFRDKCGISPSSGIKTLFSIGKKPQSQEAEMAGSPILDKIKAARAAQGAQALTTAPAANISAPTVTAEKSPSAQQATPPVGAETLSASPGTVVNSAMSVASGNQENSHANLVVNPSNQPASAVVIKGPVSGLMAKIQAKGKGFPALSGPIAQAYGKEIGHPDAKAFAGGGELSSKSVSSLNELMKLATGVVPPEAPPRAQAVITKPGDAVTDPLKIMEPSEDESESDGEDDSANVGTSNPGALSAGDSPAVGAQSTVVANVPVAPKRGRPSAAEIAAREAAKKAEFDAAVEAEVQKRLIQHGDPESLAHNASLADLQARLAEALQIAEASQQDAKHWEAKAKAQTDGGQSSEGLTLYVDCFPTKGAGEITDFFEWIGPICAGVAQQNSVGDWRQINYVGKGLLANAIREVIKAEGTPKALTISTYAGGADIALEVLTPLAKRVIKKV